MRRPNPMDVVSLTLVALLTACGPARPQPAAPRTPGPAPTAATDTPRAPGTQDPLLTALLAQLASVKPDGSNLNPLALDRELVRQFRSVQVDRLAKPGELNPLLLVTDNRQPVTQAIVAWPDGGMWHVEMLPAWPVSLLWARTLMGWKVHRTTDRIEMLLSWANLGDRKARTVEFLVMENGHWHRGWYQQPWWQYAAVDLTDITEFRVRYDAFDTPNDPFIEDHDCAECPHTHRIEVWKRSQDQFEQKSATMEMTPYHALKRFLVFQAAGETERAAALTVSVQVYRQVTTAGLKVIPNLKADIPFGKMQPISLSPLGMQVSFVQAGDGWLISGVNRLSGVK